MSPERNEMERKLRSLSAEGTNYRNVYLYKDIGTEYRRFKSGPAHSFSLKEPILSLLWSATLADFRSMLKLFQHPLHVLWRLFVVIEPRLFRFRIYPSVVPSARKLLETVNGLTESIDTKVNRADNYINTLFKGIKTSTQTIRGLMAKLIGDHTEKMRLQLGMTQAIT